MSQEGINSRFRNGIYNLEQKTELLDTKLTNVSSSLQSVSSSLVNVSSSLVNVSSSVDFLLTNNSFDSIVATGTLTFAPAAESKIVFNSLVNQGSDKAFILYKDDSSYHINGSNENSRLSIGLYNDNESTSGEGLDLQGAGSLIFNVGTWDSQLNTSIGAQYGLPSGNPIKFRINNVDKAYFDSNGGLTASVGIKVGSAGIVFNDGTYQESAGGVSQVQVSGAITGALYPYSTRADISASFGLKNDISSSFSLKTDLTSSYVNKSQLSASYPTRAEVSGAITGSGYALVDSSNTFTKFNRFNLGLQAGGLNSTNGLDINQHPTTGIYLLYVDTPSRKIGINDNTPSYTLDINGDTRIVNSFYSGPISKRLSSYSGFAGTTVSTTIVLGDNFYYSPPSTDFTASFISVPIDSTRLITLNIYLSQSATPRKINALSINGNSALIKWIYGTIPTGSANKIDHYIFDVFYDSSNIVALGKLESYG